MMIDWKDVGIRALKTFVQAACASTVTLLSSGAGDKALTMSAIISVLAAGVSAVWNAVVQPLLEKLTNHGK